MPTMQSPVTWVVALGWDRVLQKLQAAEPTGVVGSRLGPESPCPGSKLVVWVRGQVGSVLS